MHTVKIGAGKSGKKHKIKKHLTHGEDVIKIASAYYAPVAPTSALKIKGAT